jgi:hypothetical protein
MGIKSQFVIWKSKMPPHVCALGDLTGVEREWELLEGMPRAEGFPDSVTCKMDPEFPKNTLLADNLMNSAMAIIVSSHLKEFLESKSLAKVEYLPLTILDHRGKPASRACFIVHPIDPVDCLDLKKCKPTWSRIEESWIKNVESLVLEEQNVASNRALFRPKAFHKVTFVRRELAEAIDKEGFTGIRWLELDEFPE